MARAAQRTAAKKTAAKKTAVRYTVSSPVEYEANGEVETVWCRCGSAFPLKNGEGFTILLNTLPTNGKLVLMPFEPDEEAAD